MCFKFCYLKVLCRLIPGFSSLKKERPFKIWHVFYASIYSIICMVSQYWEGGGKSGGLRERKIIFWIGEEWRVKREKKCTCWSALRRNSDLCIPRKELRGLSHNFQSCVCEWFIYSHDRSTYFPGAEYEDRLWEYINGTQKHECRNWDFGHAVLFWEYFEFSV